MNSGILPFLLLSATLGLVLSFAPARWAAIGGLTSAVTALAVYALAPLQDASPAFMQAVFLCLWASIIVTGVIAYLPLARSPRWVVPAALNAGVWTGACAALTASLGGLVVGLLPILLVIPGTWFTRRKFCIVIKVVVSWMIAIAALSTFVSLIPTPGYEPDHME
ncbi:hypothetical protein H8M03_06460 [Sphingomonas sabuli]|uniref:Uncharacterized protein n=1 Tax=Sphingomonas sabuli TaxID=2764186 RepID=A0A7G9KZB7_9SPHN|nr:hypothetical protein [Sphingomonas sabuli]QNM81716.1 hypothetical protein H8M03_06460 [Sphingomonas sabuli]